MEKRYLTPYNYTYFHNLIFSIFHTNTVFNIFTIISNNFFLSVYVQGR